ncbi:PREDICTED: callose synthase 12 [Theobroma cacao]|uniref:1,3-beta-glucan synthase n=1 Tax=Theobroma cacao TaxID=3641 RepID=A0AB32WAI2_THECC|nr:PREDICTED: callose synthase 12 [Theobroma cacao]
MFPGSGSSTPDDETYNIIPVQNLQSNHPSLRYPEVRAAISALSDDSNLRKPSCGQWHSSMDLLDWLGLFFGFQRDNVKNQREHLVLHLANAQIRLSPPPTVCDVLDTKVLRKFRRKLLENYTKWCSYLWIKPNVCIPNSSRSNSDPRTELLYVGLYLLIWGESANLRFMPECICYIFHHMAMELNKILRNEIDENTGLPVMPSTSGENAFLNCVVKPMYETIKGEVERSKNGTAPHSSWRNYDDLNEYFWSNRCFKKLKWPINVNSEFFVTSSARKRIKKTGFVEQRSFLSLYRSFDRLWVMLLLFLQAAVIVAWEEKGYPWEALYDKYVEIKLLTLFITWSGMRFLHALLEAMSEYSRVSKETLGLGIRMVLKIVVATAWVYAFVISYGRIWRERNKDGQWSGEVNNRVIFFLWLAFLYGLPELLALDLFFLPFIRSFIEDKNWKIFYLVSWWFETDSFVGQGLREGLLVNVTYILFWVVVLATKFSFSYFLQIKPVITTTKQLLDFHNAEYEWSEFFHNSNKLVLGLLWMPVVLIYLIDTQIWYSIYSPFVGTAVGLFQHLGEIRNIKQLRLRFQFFASAIQFNLMVPELPFNSRETLKKMLKDSIQRLKLRYGLGRLYKKIESSQVEATRFALIWNVIVTTFRKEDIISDQEFQLLELPPNCWDVRVIRWPCFLLCNELQLALRQAKELPDAPDAHLWSKISKNEYRRCAVIETYDSLKYLMLKIVKISPGEHNILDYLFREIDEVIRAGKFTQVFKMIALPQIHTKLIKLVDLLLEPNKDESQVVNTLQVLYGIVIHDFFRVKLSTNELRQMRLAPQNPAAVVGLLFENAVELPDFSDKHLYSQVRRLHTILTTKDLMQNFPINLEARRRLAFFSNSLFTNMPRAPLVNRMMAFSVLTPYYNEEVLYGKEQLQIENEDGVSILYYLQTIYDDEWKNFMERMRREGMERDDEIWTTKLRDLMLWASYRGQTLARTVRGMAYYHRALKLLAYLDSASEMDIRLDIDLIDMDKCFDGFNSQSSSSSTNLGRRSSLNLFQGDECTITLMKYTHVVSCQKYGEHNAEEIMNLLRNNESLRIAYVDEISTRRDKKEYYSVLFKYDQQLQRAVEIYRVKLPGPFQLGEGKPENQNHALIFTRGDALQTIDMNQDNCFEDALKMRNLLEEFRHYHGIRKPTILGVREHIFSGSVSSLAWFMSSQETSFVTLVQRLLANPLKIRMHYGHPDVFDRFWFITRGGISKASKVNNISEDIFAGFNCTLRGGCVTHHEYIQVGKGRDLGMNQISMFEAKIAGGNGEQVLSRDVYRLGQRLDFFRMLSFFHTTVGYFFNTTMVILTVYVFLWGQLYLALGGVQDSDLRNDQNIRKALGAVLNQEVLVQFGLLTTLPMIIESSLEHGFLGAVWELLMMQLQLSIVFYTFSMGTRAHFFGRTILHGGAKYQATGRGFVVHHTSFAENYRLFSRSHFIKAIELGLILIVYALYVPVVAKNTFFYIDMAMTCWFLVLSWIMAPFVFNPSGFDWFKTVKDFDDFMKWIWHQGSVFAKAEQSWERWWYEEQDHLRTTSLFGKLLEIILDLRFFFFQYGIVYHLGIAAHSKSIYVYLLSWIYFVVACGVYLVLSFIRKKHEAKKHIYCRLAQFLVIVFGILFIIALLQFTVFKFGDIFTGLLATLPTGWGLISIAQVFRPLLQPSRLWDLVVSIARIYDILFGVIVMAPVAFLSLMPGVQSMQTRILFNEAFGRGLQMLKIISGIKPKKDLYGPLDLRKASEADSLAKQADLEKES